MTAARIITRIIMFKVAEMIRDSIEAHTQPIPAVLEIPSKDHPYDATKDSILRRAKVNIQIVFAFSNFSIYLITLILCFEIGYVQSRRYSLMRTFQTGFLVCLPKNDFSNY